MHTKTEIDLKSDLFCQSSSFRIFFQSITMDRN